MQPDAHAYQRVAADLRHRIAAGEFPPGARLPSWRTLQRQYQVGYGVIADAIALLRTDGLVVSTQRTSVTVADPAKVQQLTDVDAPWPHGRGDIQRGTAPADQSLAARLDVEPGTRVAWERVELLDEDGRPSHLCAVYRRPGSRNAAVRTMDAVARARMLSAEEAEHLGLAIGVTQVVRATRVDEQGQPVETVELVLPADRWSVSLG
ncbi:GntR family transcriptional regulator [Peterkaempfera griseoplana]|uniref:GntR family transcriptional regulator n=1 Tax=Peterkaempfera griseoplana TaxID=66896 RepID=UPI0006E3AC7F|nr:GntR family transcriptional regulator [Peterkaempfera griseoplana]